MKKWLKVSLCMIGITVLAACGGKESTGDGEINMSKEDEQELANIDIMLDWYPNAVHSYLYVAQKKGYFEEEGVKVNIHFPANPTDPINLAAAGKMTLGISYQPDVIVARANQDIPIKSIGAIVHSPLNHMVFLEDSDIKEPKDLIGKKVGYPGIPLNEALLKTIVQHEGGNPDDVQLIDVGFELGSSIISKQVDAVLGAFINHEVPVLRYNGHETRNFNPVDYGVPSYYELVVVTNDQTWEEQEDEIKAFWRAATKGYEFMKEQPDEALNILLSNQDEANFPLVEEIERESLDILLPKMESELGFGSQDEQIWKETIEWMIDLELIKESPNLDDIFVDILK